MSWNVTTIGALIARMGRHSIRRPAIAYVLPTAMPLGLLVFITQLYAAMVDGGGYPVDDLMDWMGPGIVFLGVTMGGGFTGSLLVADSRSGFLDRQRMLLVRPSELVVAALIFEAIRILPVGVVLYGVAAVMGLELPGAGAMALTLVLAGIWAAAWNSLFVLASLRTGSEQLSLVLLPMFLPFFLGSTLMVPRHLLPGYIQAIIDWNPLDRFVIAVRPMFLTETVDVAALTAAATVSLGIATLLGAFAVRNIDAGARDSSS